jgi:hypothetical protein
MKIDPGQSGIRRRPERVQIFWGLEVREFLRHPSENGSGGRKQSQRAQGKSNMLISINGLA